MRKWIEPKQWFPSPLGALQKLDKAIPLVTKKMGAAQVRSSVLAYVPLNRQEFEECPYDLSEIARASSTESLVAQSFSKHLSLCLKEGWEIAGRDESALDYVKKRLFQMELATAVTFDDLVRRAMKNFIETSNSFLVYRRDKTLSPGASINKFGKLLEPIAGVFSANPASMQIRRNKFGDEKQYYQVIRSTPSIYFYIADKHFDSSEVLHIAYDRLDGYAWGRPFVISVLDDIRLLRSLEEMASLMCFKSAIPMYQYKVGNDLLLPIQYTDGTTELDKVEDDIREKDSHGFFVTPGHHDLKNVDGGNNVRDITKYLDFFRSRVISGLNLSSVDLGMGDTSNRNTANAMSKNLQSKCKDFQKSFSEQIQELFDELLLEGGFTITPETRVSLFWKEIDVEGRHLIENHVLAQYQGHMISFPEARRAIGREPLPDGEEESMFFSRVEKPRIEVTGDQKAKLGSAKEGAQKSTTSKEKPANQHKTRGAAKKKGDSYNLLSMRVQALVSTIKEDSGTILDCDSADILKSTLRQIIEEATDDPSALTTLALVNNGSHLDTVSAILLRRLQNFCSE